MALTAFELLVFALFPLGLAFGAAFDIFSMTIPNRVAIALFAGFLAAAPAAGFDLGTFGLHCAAGSLVLAGGFGLFSFGWIGGGDAKFAAVIALWLGWAHTVDFLVVSAICGGVLTFAVLLFRRNLLPVFAIRQAWLVRLHDPTVGVPYGVALAAAALAIYPHTIWAETLLG